MIVSSKWIINKRYIPNVAWWLEFSSRDQIKLIWYCYFNIKQYSTTQNHHTQSVKNLSYVLKNASNEKDKGQIYLLSSAKSEKYLK